MYVKGGHGEDRPGRLAANGEGFDQQVVERVTVGDPLLEFLSFLFKLGVGELQQPRLEVVDSGDDGTKGFDFPFVLSPKDFRKDRIEHETPSTILTRYDFRHSGGVGA